MKKKTFEVELRGTMELIGFVRVDASSECEAKQLAQAQANNDQVIWDPVGGMTAKTKSEVMSVREVK
jgi:hypothetical protein